MKCKPGKINFELFIRAYVYVHQNGGLADDIMFGENVYSSDNINFEIWNVNGVQKPTVADLPLIDEAKDYLKIIENNKIQNKKDLKQKQYENSFFDIISAVLNELDDERKNESPIPKLDLDELQALLEVISETNFNLSVTLSLRLMAINSALIRFDIKWWERAEIHNI
jgi:hypothetical protein